MADIFHTASRLIKFTGDLTIRKFDEAGNLVQQIDLPEGALDEDIVDRGRRAKKAELRDMGMEDLLEA
jgi:hypothetical protein